MNISWTACKMVKMFNVNW